MPGPAYRIETERLVLRCWDPRDAPLLAEAVTESVEHLLPWMPWARQEPEPLDAKVERLRVFRGSFDLGKDFILGIFSADESRVIGGTGFHPRVGKGAHEIGYWIRASEIGKGLATEASAALTKVAFEVDGVSRVEIHCDPSNVRSARVPEKLGYVHEATLRGRITDGEEPRDSMIWSIFADGYPTSPSASAAVRAYDAAGRKLL